MGNIERPKWQTHWSVSFSPETSDFILYDDDANIEYNDINGILPKLQTYKETAEPEYFL